MTSVTIGWWAGAGTRAWRSTELKLTQTGGELVRASRAQVAAWTAEYGIELPTR